MWIRKRLDISTRDLLYGIYSCFSTGSVDSITNKIKEIWKKEEQSCFVCLSVRTGFDLLFQALNFEAGSEILMSALTIPDMPRIVEHHGLIPVPIDLNIETLAPDIKNIEAAVTPKTRAIVIAHLFGGIVDIDQIKVLANKYNLLIIEDCAQAFYSKSFSGSISADVSMFSFGIIKTATALGGGLLFFRNKDLPLAKIEQLNHSYPFQERKLFLKKILKYLLLNRVASKRIFPIIIKLIQKRGKDYDLVLHDLSRSFPNDDFFHQIRKRSSFPLLKFMHYRFKTYDFSKIEMRIERGNFLVRNLPQSLIFPGEISIHQTYWVFPILSSKPKELVSILAKAGFDATNRSSLKVVSSNKNNAGLIMPNADRILNQIIYLPLYPEMPLNEFVRMQGCFAELK